MVKVTFDLSDMTVPETVGGVAVPPELRRSAQALLAKAASPEGREVIAAALSLAGAVLAATSARNGARNGARSGTGGGAVGASVAAPGSGASDGDAAPTPAPAPRVLSAGAAGMGAAPEPPREPALPPEPVAPPELTPPPAPPPPAPPPARAPGSFGIDPAINPGDELAKALTIGLGALQAFWGGRRPG